MAEKTYSTYVDLSPDLAEAWRQIQSDPTGTQGSYWLKRGATSKEAFGKAHAAEDMALKTGSYKQSGTDYKKDSDKWKELFTTQPGQFGTAENYPEVSTAAAPKTRYELFTPKQTSATDTTTTDTTTTDDTTTADTTTADTTTAADTTTTTSTGDGVTQGTVEKVAAPVVDAPVVVPFDMAKLTDSMDLTNKLTEIINTNSPLFKAAQTKAMQNMQRRGLVNSTLAQEAVMNAIIDVALPIAQAEVDQLVKNLYFNTEWTNKQKAQANEAAYNKMLTQLQGSLNFTVQQLTGSQNIGLQNLKGQQAIDVQNLIGTQETKLQQDKVKAELWSKYGDWVTTMASTEGADQEAWKNMLDMLIGSGGWPKPT